MTKYNIFLIGYFLFAFFFFIFFASGFVDSQDGFQYLAISRRLYYDHTFEMPSESFDNDKNIHMSLVDNEKTGKLYSPTGLGYSLSLLPAVFVEDVFLRISGTKPISAFPLENDWPVLLFASMTNSFWGALFVVTLYVYFIEIKLKHKQALLLSFLLSIGTNIFVYTKHTFAQMMFVALMTASFYFLRRFSSSKKMKDIFLSGIFMGGVVITYNLTFSFLLPSYAFYYLLLMRFKFSFYFVRKLIVDVFIFSIGFIPFAIVYLLFNHLRLGGNPITSYGSNSFIFIEFPAAHVILEGIWGLLLSPGKSIFIYSPILLVLILFWFKIKKKIFPELFAGMLLLIIFLWNIGTLLGGPDYLVWHGESSWGPRYMLPILPLFFIVIGHVYKHIATIQKRFVFFPLLFLGFYINIISMVLPYQIRFAGLQIDAIFNNRNFNVYQYGNEIPRYMPALKMTKTVLKRIKNIRRTFDHGIYAIKLADGFDYPFDLGWSVWRGMQELSVVSFENNEKSPISKMSFQVRNHQIDPQSSASATVSFYLNGSKVTSETVSVDEEKEIKLPLSDQMIKDVNNILEIKTQYESTTSAYMKKKQTLFLQILRVNDLPQNIVTLDYPYVSSISTGLFNPKYYYWGGQEKDSWSIWHMHSGVYEQTFDLWWLRPLHYWDMPKSLFAAFFVADIFCIVFLGLKTVKYKR